MSKGSAISAIVVAFVGGFAIGHLSSSGGGDHEEVADLELDAEAKGAAAEAAGNVERFKLPVSDKQPAKGPGDALVTIVEFSEFQCPFCARVLPTTKKIVDEYGDKVRIVWRNNPLPFHNNAMSAGVAAMEAFEQGGAEKFWSFHDTLFENQRALGRPDLERYAQQAGLDMAQFKAALDNNEHKAAIEADQKLAQSLGARGTPAFFINGRKLMGAQPYEKFKEIIDDEVRRAEQMVGAGVPKARLYAEFIKNAKTSPGEAPAADNKQPQRRQPDPKAVYKVPADGAAFKGSPNALVTIIEFSEFQCPFCSRVLPTVKQILDTYGNDVRVGFMHNPLPFHNNALPASVAALEVREQGGDAKFWQYHDVLFANQRELTRENLEKWARELGGINMAQFKAALDNNEHKPAVDKMQQLARSLGATGTPAFFINGRNLRGAQPFEAFKAVIDEELAKARKLVQSGTPRNRVYEETIKNGATSPQFLAGAAPAPGNNARPDPNKKYEIAVPRNAPRKGAANAKVVIQEFSDFECPFCGRVNPTVKQILDTYGDKVAIVWRNYPLPFHRNAQGAAEAALEVFRQGGNAKFWAYHDLLFANQRELTRENLEKWAQQVGGINMAQFRQALDTHRHQAAVEADKKAVTDAGARIGTPSFFINGQLVQGAQPFEAFKAKIDAALNN